MLAMFTCVPAMKRAEGSMLVSVLMSGPRNPRPLPARELPACCLLPTAHCPLPTVHCPPSAYLPTYLGTVCCRHHSPGAIIPPHENPQSTAWTCRVPGPCASTMHLQYSIFRTYIACPVRIAGTEFGGDVWRELSAIRPNSAARFHGWVLGLGHLWHFTPLSPPFPSRDRQHALLCRGANYHATYWVGPGKPQPLPLDPRPLPLNPRLG
ncbi:hypothetical protein BKA56DRAFT_329832 [Ilyonectria sp. MPI-CAGE-AT-0026]|nr:hypothetical protein BKA56DRAFT_329832 [Ilyonectria sp. MPI-CAGE-AT-0026]